jgi:hypothetical protein
VQAPYGSAHVTIPRVDARTLLSSPPSTLRVGSPEQSLALKLSDELVARHDAGPSATSVASFEGERIAVEPASAAAERNVDRGSLGPVYRQSPGGGLAVPTGRAFVSFAEGEDAARHGDDLAAVGYEIDAVPGYAPHAAWVRPASGSVVDGLRNLERLERVPGVEAVQPQVLTEAGRRADR